VRYEGQGEVGIVSPDLTGLYRLYWGHEGAFWLERAGSLERSPLDEDAPEDLNTHLGENPHPGNDLDAPPIGFEILPKRERARQLNILVPALHFSSFAPGRWRQSVGRKDRR